MVLGVKGRKCRFYESNYHSFKGELLALRFHPYFTLKTYLAFLYYHKKAKKVFERTSLEHNEGSGWHHQTMAGLHTGI